MFLKTKLITNLIIEWGPIGNICINITIFITSVNIFIKHRGGSDPPYVVTKFQHVFKSSHSVIFFN
jgi:hypothetical protein